MRGYSLTKEKQKCPNKSPEQAYLSRCGGRRRRGAVKALVRERDGRLFPGPRTCTWASLKGLTLRSQASSGWTRMPKWGRGGGSASASGSGGRRLIESKEINKYRDVNGLGVDPAHAAEVNEVLRCRSLLNFERKNGQETGPLRLSTSRRRVLILFNNDIIYNLSAPHARAQTSSSSINSSAPSIDPALIACFGGRHPTSRCRRRYRGINGPHTPSPLRTVRTVSVSTLEEVLGRVGR